MNRRSFIGRTITLSTLPICTTRAYSKPGNDLLSSITTLTFDCGGTVFDWHQGISRALAKLSVKKGFKVDSSQFANGWRLGMLGIKTQMEKGELPTMNAEEMHLRALRAQLRRSSIDSLSEEEILWLNRVWHRLPAFPDVKPGLERLRKKFTVIGFSILNYATLVDASKLNGLSWDGLLSGEFMEKYKVHKRAYQQAAELLMVKPEQVLMVASHVIDLRGSMTAGNRTAYVDRPNERGTGGTRPKIPEGVSFDYMAKSFEDLAAQLGA